MDVIEVALQEIRNGTQKDMKTLCHCLVYLVQPKSGCARILFHPPWSDTGLGHEAC